MGKNSDRESLIREITNLVVHEIVTRYTNKPESRHYVDSEIINYRGNAEKKSKTHNWNDFDKESVKEKALKDINKKLAVKYSDIIYPEEEALTKLNKVIEEIM
jgi:hypothetical protein